MKWRTTMKLNIRPISGQVLVELKEEGSEAKVGKEQLIVVQRDSDPQHQDVGRVLAMGDMAFLDDERFGKEKPVKVGDEVVFHKYDGKALIDFDTGKCKWRVLYDHAIWGVVDKSVDY